ncbi:MAG: ankyrin repeat domain-containing protein [bacterium]|nr:ankyrin repeat domain-containing protein [bacterium]
MSRAIEPLTGRSRDFLELVLPAAGRGDIAAVEHYLAAEPRFLRAIGPHGRTVLWEAARKGRTELVQWLAAAGADLEARGCYFRETSVEVSPWCIAKFRKKRRTADALVELGAAFGFEAACFLGDFERARALAAADSTIIDAPVVTHSPVPERPLHHALAGAHFEVFEWLLECGASATDDAERMLAWALGSDDERFARLLLERGARPRPGDANEACREPRWVTILARYGYEADWNAPDRLGFPPLVEACRGNHNAAEDVERVTELLALGARVDVTDHKGKTALHRAAQANFVAAIDVLVAAGADLEVGDRRGETPLFDAVRAGRIAATQRLLELGADLARENGLGQTVELLASRSKKRDARAVRDLLS